MYNVFTEEVNKTPLSANNDKRTKPINSIERYAYVMSKDLIWKNEKIKCNNMMKQYRK